MEFSQNELEIYSAASREAARRGGQILLKWLGKTTTQEKGFRDLVTQADYESQQVIQDFLKCEFPNHHFIGEESTSESHESSQSDFCWIVDPLDGTTNYVHGLRSFAVSIALYHHQTPLVGTVLDPVLEECYWASQGLGAKLNGELIRASGCNEIDKSLFVFSFPRGMTRTNPEVIRFLNMLENVGSIRRLGSAALNLCYVACGRADGYWATSLAKWDVAAGWLIAREAGASIEDFRGHQLDLEKPFFCAAATSDLLEQVKPLLNV
ncbi:MAG: inositol monophosphatase family protein [Mariniblastus sp.]|nr:inositol monophosphatase family protein [Mariniblastus sp.]